MQSNESRSLTVAVLCETLAQNHDREGEAGRAAVFDPVFLL